MRNIVIECSVINRPKHKFSNDLRDEYIAYITEFEDDVKSGKISKAQTAGLFIKEITSGTTEPRIKLTYSDFLLEKILLSLEK